MLAALAQDTRLSIFRLLVRAGRSGLRAGAIAERLDLPAATCSFHLKELRQSGVASCCRDGRSLIYGADFRAIRSLLDYLTRHCCSLEEEPEE